MKLILYSAPAALAGAAGAYHSDMVPFIILLLLYYFLKSSSIVILSVSMMICILFYLQTDHQLQALQTSISPEQSSLSLNILTPFTEGENKRAVAIHGSEKLMITIPEKHQALIDKVPAHSKCIWEGELMSPQPAENFNAFDYQRYLFYENIHWIFRVHDFKNCIPVKKSFFSLLTDLRAKGTARTEEIFPDHIKGIAGALLFGDRGMMEEEQIRMYQRLGVIHLLAISGMHVGMITFFLWKVLLRAGLTKETIRISLFIILPFYAVMAGAASPVLRAVGMVLLGLSLQYVFVRLPLLHILSTVFVIHLFLFPLELVNAGFQLSYAVSFTLAISSGRILKYQNKIVSLLMVTTVAQLGAMPIILWHFYELSLSSLFMNLIYVPLYTLVILPSFIFIYLLSFISMDAAIYAAMIPATLIAPVEHLSALISDIKRSVLISGKPPTLKLIILSAGLIVMLSLFEKARFKLSGCCLIVLIAYMLGSPYLNPKGSITFISVGQGDSILIQLPFNRGNYLIDTGGQVHFGEADDRFSVGEKIVLPYLKSMGISTIDLLILTHHDWDHIGGAQDLLKELFIKEVWTSEGSADKEEMKTLLEAFVQEGTPVKEITETATWEVGGNKFKLITPDDHLEGNNASLVLQADMGGKKWLFTGDIEKETEEGMSSEFEDIDVLKVAHHGSKSSSTQAFLDIAKPEFAIISAGKNNVYGHPHPDVIKRLEGTEVYITSVNGAVRYTFTEGDGTFEVATPYNIEK
ncbi:DNA internalization-related competence protein ComEC/Rec2 [Jeotgalibacillus malaysiensis]|uniref:DNA internalization-related competence protein ComEC/Rec2 n=1 Tax=Jeotgalibacillus malaysiensis TaxID=1508404 RepID=UPI0038508158